MSDVFISYSHIDLDSARKIDNLLRETGIDVWRDERMSPGIKFEGEIQKQLKSSRVCLFLLSHAFLSSEYCQNEVGYAEALGIAFLPCRLDNCNPKGFLASRNYIDLFNKDAWHLDYSFQMDMAGKVRKLIALSRREGLRVELLDFYTHLLRLIESSGTSTVHYLRILSFSLNSSVEQTQEQSSETAEQVVNGIIAYLKDGKPVDALFPIWLGGRPEHNDCLPAWRLRTSSITQINASTQFQVVPDITLREIIYEEGNIIEARIAFLQEYACQNREDYQNASKEKKDTLYYLYNLLPDIAHGEATASQLVGIGWGKTDTNQAELILIPSKGIYRIGLVTKDDGHTKIILTKYLSVEATRVKLGISAAELDPEPAIRTDLEDSSTSNTLELMYMGFSRGQRSGGKLSFLLYNNHKSIAIVQSIDVVVHNVVPRGLQFPPPPGAGLKEYRNKVTLYPKKGRIRAMKDSFKYSPGEVDKFTFELCSAEPGYNYEISVMIEWMDISSGKLRKIETPKEFVVFPIYSRY